MAVSVFDDIKKLEDVIVGNHHGINSKVWEILLK